ncbi:DPP IV N-terminal domain-containing protein, partial [candidate division KSB1 bacterium]
VDPKQKTKTKLFDNGDFAAKLSTKLHKPIDPQQLDSYSLKFSKDMKTFEFETDSIKFRYELATGKLDSVDRVKRPERSRLPSWMSFSPDSSYITYAKNYNLYIMGADSVEHQLSTDGEQYYSFGGDTSKTRKTRARVNWSEDSKWFYATRSDSRKVKELFLINEVADPRPTLRTYKYEMPGDENVAQHELFVYNVDVKDFKKIDIDRWKDQKIAAGVTSSNGGGSFSSLRWGKTTNELFFQRRARTNDKQDLVALDPGTGEIRILVDEYIEDVSIDTKNLVLLHESNEMIWWSERTGWGHFYLYDKMGNLKNPITAGAFRADGITKIDTTGRVLYFTGKGREKDVNVYFSFLYRVNFDGTGMKMLSPGDGQHSVSISPTTSFFVDTYSRVDTAPSSVLRDNQGNMIMELEKTDISKLQEYGWQFPEPFIVKMADGVIDNYGVMFKPFNFDPEKKYPIIAHVYPGPQTESVSTTFTPTNRDMTLAQLGFIVVQLGNRGGSPLRNKAYHRFGRGNFRDYGLADKKAGIEQLANKYSFIDVDRVGIYGHSGGGFMSTAAMLVPPYNEFFKVAVSSSGNHDNTVYSKWWGETHSGVQEVTKKVKTEDEKTEEQISFESKIQTNPEMAENLKGKLLLAHGTMDNNVHPANTIRVVNALIKANKRFDLIMFPGKAHGFGDM